jgi:hypothetical protein
MYFLNIKYKWNIPEKIIKKYNNLFSKINYFKNNWMWKKILSWKIFNYSKQYEKLQNLEKLRKEILEKLEK